MGYNEDLISIKKKVNDLISVGFVDQSGKDFYESTLIQIMNDAERNRQTCINSADNLKRQAAILEGQSSGFASVSSLIMAVLNGFILLAEKNKREQEERDLEKSEPVEEEKVVRAKRKQK